MADNESFSGSQVAGGSYSQLLFADDNGGLDTDGCYNYNTAFSAENPPKMLCFGEIEYSVIVSETKRTAEKSEITCSDSSTNNSAINSLSKADRKRNASVRESAGTGAPSRTPTKKTKSERSDLTGHGKVKREKLGERITALQQLVSPYGKTDTASVLHEAMGYIKFLQEQVQVLCSPYLQTLPPSSQEGENRDGEVRKDLRSRGLCLVPVECTALVANNNGADFWSPAMGNNFSPKP